MENLKREIYAILSDVGSTYYELAPESAVFPCIVYRFDQYNQQNYPRIDTMLEIQVLDKSDGSSGVDTLSQSIISAIDRQLINKTTINIKIYFEDRTEIIDNEEKQLKGRQLRFSLQVYNY
jgi:hypothetical protein